jgi:hypothetical protein
VLAVSEREPGGRLNTGKIGRRRSRRNRHYRERAVTGTGRGAKRRAGGRTGPNAPVAEKKK